MKFQTEILLIALIGLGCERENHIDEYKVNLDSLKSLPNNFYSYRGGRIYIEDLNLSEYRIWFDLDNNGNIKDIFKIDDFQRKTNDIKSIINNYKIDTIKSKKYAQRFIELSDRFFFGHICVDKNNLISFSYKDGLAEQYVMSLNDSIKKIYKSKKNFKQLKNGWFMNLEN